MKGRNMKTINEGRKEGINEGKEGMNEGKE